MAAELTTKEVAEELGIPLGTLKSWLNKIPVSVQTDSSGNRRFGEGEIEIIRQIQALRLEEGRGMETIRRRLQLDSQDEAQTQLGSSPDETRSNPADDQPHASIVDTSLIVEAVTAAIAQQTDLSEKYARAAHQIGGLEAENRFLKDQLNETREQLLKAQEKVQQLEAPQEKPAPMRSWWKFWT